MKKTSRNRLTFLSFAFFILTGIHAQNSQRSFYQVTIYHFTEDAQEVALDHYLQHAYLPALSKRGIGPVGVFKPLKNDRTINIGKWGKIEKKIYVFIPLHSMQDAVDLTDQLLLDAEYLKAAKPYLDAHFGQPPYTRIEKLLLRAFEMAPQLTLPKIPGSKRDRIYELRNYESPTERLSQNKIQMFNEGEIQLFDHFQIYSIFFGEVVIGCRMPNMMYLTCFENKAVRDIRWRTFSDSHEWDTFLARPGVVENVTKTEFLLMRATEYSQY